MSETTRPEKTDAREREPSLLRKQIDKLRERVKEAAARPTGN